MSAPTLQQSERVCVGQFAGAHGVRGLVRIRSFTAEPIDVVSYGPVEDESGTRRFRLTPKGMAKGAVIVAIGDAVDRDAAQLLNGTRLYVARDCLPPLADEEEFYQADLIGCAVVDLAGKELGIVREVHDFGAGTLLEVAPPQGPTLLLPFSESVVPEIDLAQRRLVVDLPTAIDGPAGESAAGDAAGDAA
jgi:16S rRNA processing protein RimM